MKTAQEVANELDLTRTEVYNLLRKKRFSPLVKKNGGQVAISNELFKLLEEEIKNKRNNIKQQENKNIDIKQEDKSLEEKNTIVDVKTEENTDFVKELGITQAPTLITKEGEKISNASNIKAYAEGICL